MFPVLKRNAFALLPETFLVSLVSCPDQEYRDIAVNLILNVRENPPAPPRKRLARGIRISSIPEVNLDAGRWEDLVDISSIQVHDPPILREKGKEELEQMIQTPFKPPKFMIHTQSVERAVKITSEASKKAYSLEKRHALIVSKQKSRSTRKSFISKGHYQV